MQSPPEDFHHPFQPYEIQKDFMSSLYMCIERGMVGIFESPTGMYYVPIRLFFFI